MAVSKFPKTGSALDVPSWGEDELEMGQEVTGPTYGGGTDMTSPTYFQTPTAGQDDRQTSAKGQSPTTPSYQTPEQLAPNNAQAWASTSQGSAPGGNPYGDMLSQINQTTDATQKAVLQDQLSRQMFNDLKTAGHDVKWQGDQLIVDGRPYVVNGQSNFSNTQSDPNTSPGPGWTRMGNQWVNTSGQQGAQTQQPQGDQFGSTDPEYLRGAIIAEFAKHGYTPNEDEIQQWLRYTTTPTGQGGRELLGWDPYWQMRIGYHARGEDYGAQFGPPPTAAGPAPMESQGAAGVQTGSIGQASYAQPAPQNSLFPTSGPGYVPGEIDQLDGFDPLADNGQLDEATRASIMKLLEGGGAVDAATEAALLKLLQNPHSVDDRTIEMLKAQSKEEEAALFAQEDEALRTAGFAGGFDDSRWLASERLAGRRQRDEGIIRGNREIDLTAAQTRKADERSAIEAGASYAAQKAGRDQAAVASSQSYMALKSDNAFKTASLQGDRLALRESVNQKAAELGLSGDELQLRYTLGQIDDATRRYGIDVGASIDRAKLAQAGREFQEELAFKFAQLEQMDAQFGASYGLDMARFRSDEDQRLIDNTRTTYGTN